MLDPDFEYLPVKRELGTKEWFRISEGSQRAYRWLPAAKSLLTKEKRNDERWNDYGYTTKRYNYEYAIQRRPIGAWEVMNDTISTL